MVMVCHDHERREGCGGTCNWSHYSRVGVSNGVGGGCPLLGCGLLDLDLLDILSTQKYEEVAAWCESAVDVVNIVLDYKCNDVVQGRRGAHRIIKTNEKFEL